MSLKLGVFTIGGDRVDTPGMEFPTWNPSINPRFAIANPLPADYLELSDMADWVAYRADLFALGTAGFKDYLCLSAKIQELVFAIAGPDLSTWSSLTSGQKTIAMQYMPDTVARLSGADFAATVPSPAVRGALCVAHNVAARTAMITRMQAATAYLEGMIEYAGYIHVANDISAVLFTQMLLGIYSQAVNGYSGIFDYIMATGDYAGAGFPMVAPVPYDGVTTVPDMQAAIVAILNGQY